MKPSVLTYECLLPCYECSAGVNEQLVNMYNINAESYLHILCMQRWVTDAFSKIHLMNNKMHNRC